MNWEQFILNNIAWFILVILLISLWDLIWKGIALYLSGERQQKVWFIFLLIVNSMGILPIIYLVLNKRSGREQ